MSERKSKKTHENGHSKPYDLVIWGATGYTGQLIAEYLAAQTLDGGDASKIKWAIAGRSEKRLNELKKTLGHGAENIGVLIADSSQQKTVDDMVKQTRVVIGSVGPFLLYGDSLVDACVRLGVDYCDVTGESFWVKRVIDKYHDTAVENNVLLVPMCGFDSIPSDLGCYYAVTEFKKRFENVKCKTVHSVFHMSSGGGIGASGGTLATMLTIAQQPMKVLNEAKDPYLLNPESSRLELATKKRKEDKDQFLPAYREDHKTWTAPFVMASGNTRIVRRTIALLQNENVGYGPELSYNESMGVSNWFYSVMVSMLIIYAAILFRISFTRNLLQKFLLPKQGDGPSSEARKNSKWKVVVVAKGVTDKKEEKALQITLRGADAYEETARFVAESALALVLDRQKLRFKGGVMSPMAAFGPALIPRVHRGSFSMSVKE